MAQRVRTHSALADQSAVLRQAAYHCLPTTPALFRTPWAPALTHTHPHVNLSRDESVDPCLASRLRTVFGDFYKVPKQTGHDGKRI